MTFAETLTDKERNRSTWYAIFSALSGCIGEMSVDAGAIVVVYIAMLGGDDAAKMLISAFSSLAAICLSLSYGALSDKFGLRRGISCSGYVAASAFILMALAPYAGSASLLFMIGACLLFSLTRPLYTVCWYPILDNFLRPKDRGAFFSKMRFIYSTFNAALMFGLGKLFALIGGDYPPMKLMQGIMIVCALGQIARVYFINSIPIAPELKNPSLRAALHRHGQQYSLKEGLRTSFRNGPLVGFSIYFCFYNLIVSPVIPLAVVYMKSEEFNASPSAIFNMAAVSLVGSLVGFLASGVTVRKLGVKSVILLGHLAGIALPAILFFCEPTSPARLAIIGLSLFFTSFFAAHMMVVNSMESLALARPGNKTIALSVCNVFGAVGTAAGRFGTTALLACGFLAPSWTFKSLTITRFQSIFGAQAVIMAFFLVLLVIVPAFVPKHEDYYEP